MATLMSTPDSVTPEALTQILRSRAGPSAPGPTVRAVTSEPFGTGQMAQVVRLRITYDGPAYGAPATIIGKFPSLDEGSRAAAHAYDAYRREVLFYRTVSLRLPLRTPRSFYAEHDGHDFGLLIEDLSTTATPGDQLAGCTQSRADHVIDLLAALHGSHWDSPELPTADWLFRPDPATVAALYQVLWPAFVARYGTSMPFALMSIGERFAERIGDWFSAQDRLPRTLTHGDLRLDTLMFGSDDTTAALDWQMTSHAPSSWDLAYFTGGSLDIANRADAETDLLRHYHRALHVNNTVRDIQNAHRLASLYGVLVTAVAAMQARQTQRGDRLFTTVMLRHLTHAQDLHALDAF